MPSFGQLQQLKDEGQTLAIDRDDDTNDDNDLSNVEVLEFLDAGNIADKLPDKAGTEILTGYDEAMLSMSEWMEKYKKAMRLAKLQPKEKSKTFPFQGASTAMAPFVLEAMVDFNARSAPELAFSDNIVKVKVYGGRQIPTVPPPPQPGPGQAQMPPEEQQRAKQAQIQAQQMFEFAQAQADEARQRIDTEKEDRADRVAEYSNYQLSQLMPTWKGNQDKLLLSLPCIGTMYKKTFFDIDTQEAKSDLCYGDQIIFDQSYPTFEEAPDKYEALPAMTRNEVIEKIRGAEEWDIKEDTLSDDDTETYDFVEASTWLDLDDDGLQEPYLVIVHKLDSKAVYARPLFDEDTITVNDDGLISKIEQVERFTQYQFIPDPEGGPMGLGWGILLGPTFEEINKTIRQMQDAGTLQIVASNSGIFADPKGSGARGNRSQRGPIEMAMGKLTPVEVGGSGSLAQNVIQFPAAGPSSELFQLLGYMVDASRRLTDVSSQVEGNPNEAAALYLARLQQTLKRPNVIVMRVYNAAGKEFEKIAAINYKHFSDEKYNKVIDRPKPYSMEQDFNPDDCDIQLVADPSQGSDIERIARAEAVLQNAKTEQSTVTNMRQATIDYYKVLGVKDVELLVPEPQPDPMQQMMEQQQQMEAAREQMDAEFRQRDQRLKEADQQLRQLEMRLKQQKTALDASKEMTQLGIENDLKEADIAKKYAETLKILAEMGESDPMAMTKVIEQEFIKPAEGGASYGPRESLPIPEPTPTLPPGNPGANPAMGGGPGY